MLAVWRIVLSHGGIHRLIPFWIFGVITMFFTFQTWMLFALVYGVLIQFVVEYSMHRFLYHREPPTEQGTFNDLYRTHIGHHEFPTDPEFFSGDDHWYAPKFGLTFSVLHFLVLWPFVGFTTAILWPVVAIFVGSVTAFIYYEYCHTLAHVNVPKGWFGKRVTQSHLAHHFQDHDATFHVSFGAAWVDRLFGTHHDAAIAKERFNRDTMLSLGMDPEDLRLVTARKAFGKVFKLRRQKI